MTLLNGYVPAAADSLIILSSNQSITGAFSNVVAGHVLASDGITSLRVSVIGNHVVVGQLPGDYTGNGVVDAADYVVWRKVWERATYRDITKSGGPISAKPPAAARVPL